MKSVSVTYKAAPGDSKVTEAFGHTFYDGKPETITVDDDTLMRLQNNATFQCGEPTDAPKEEGPKPFPQEQGKKHDDDEGKTQHRR